VSEGRVFAKDLGEYLGDINKWVAAQHADGGVAIRYAMLIRANVAEGEILDGLYREEKRLETDHQRCSPVFDEWLALTARSAVAAAILSTRKKLDLFHQHVEQIKYLYPYNWPSFPPVYSMRPCSRLDLADALETILCFHKRADETPVGTLNRILNELQELRTEKKEREQAPPCSLITCLNNTGARCYASSGPRRPNYGSCPSHETRKRTPKSTLKDPHENPACNLVGCTYNQVGYCGYYGVVDTCPGDHTCPMYTSPACAFINCAHYFRGRCGYCGKRPVLPSDARCVVYTCHKGRKGKDEKRLTKKSKATKRAKKSA
jgi:hypothetical protein